LIPLEVLPCRGRQTVTLHPQAGKPYAVNERLRAE
jgi:hypothetical protein